MLYIWIKRYILNSMYIMILESINLQKLQKIKSDFDIL